MMATRILLMFFSLFIDRLISPSRSAWLIDKTEANRTYIVLCRGPFSKFCSKRPHRLSHGPNIKDQQQQGCFMQKVLITGGAGFIGSHLSDELLAHGYQVRVLDTLDPQVHGEGRRRPEYLAKDVELVVGDVCDRAKVDEALKGVDAVYHFASAVGVGQSMYEVAHYTRINNLGTAVLLEALIERPVRKLVVASSMSLYGEGMYRTAAGELRTVGERTLEQLRRGEWEWHDADGSALRPAPTPEDKAPALASVYALSKFDQERLCLMLGRAYGIPAVALRF